MDKYSITNLLIKTILWLAVGIRNGYFGQGDEISALYHEIERLKSENEILRKRLKGNVRRHHCWQEKLHILWHIEAFSIPRRQVDRVFGIARSTYYRWLHQVEEGVLAGKGVMQEEPVNKTKDDLVSLVWRVFDTNPHFGRERIAMIIQRLNVFLSPSTVRNILCRARPKKGSPVAAEVPQADITKTSNREYPGIISRYPNHVWSVDLTTVKRWLFWPTYVLMGIDHYSRKLISLSPLEGPNSGWIIESLEESINTFGAPRHIISDQDPVFTGYAFKDLLNRLNIRHRFGAVGKQGSIAVTERAIKTLKYEWLRRVALIKGFDHLCELCDSFQEWYNQYRPHLTLNGATPDDVYKDIGWRKPSGDAKKLPSEIEIKYYPQIRIAAYRLKRAA